MFRGKISILFRATLITWIVIIFALGAFATMIIPFQRKALISDMQTNASTIALSIAQVTATAIVVEDFSTVIEHCIRVLKESPSLRYVVVTRKDGFSIILTHNGWEDRTLEAPWTSPPSQGEFIKSDLVNATVFQYSHPIVYSGIDWGWIHIGLSTDKFDTDLHYLYQQTTLLFCLCIMFGLGISFLFARHMTRPIYTLNQVTARIKEGDLSARVELSSGDELENLGDSFNQMTEALQISRHELIAAKDFVEKVIRTIPDPVVITNPDNKIMIVNQATLAMLGYKEEELIGHSVRKIFSREGTFDSSGFTRQGFIQNLNVDLVTKSGEKIPVSYSGASLFDENKNSISYIISAKDMRQVRELISKLEEAKDNLSRSFEELQNTQVKLVQAGKMSAVGQLAAGVAHEINNPLTGIMINSMLLKEQFEKSELQEIAQKEDIPECLNIIVESTQRCRSIVENLLSFSRQSKDESFISLDINEVIEKSLSLVDNQLRLSKIKLEIKLDRNLPRIAGNYNKLQQVVINLILNAHQFMPGGGTIDIASSLSRDESFVEVRVQDTGPGISRENMDKIFEPFFSTLQSSQSSRAGTGLGLSICYGIAKEHNGTIEVESSEGYGATFTVRLPVRSRKEQ